MPDQNATEVVQAADAVATIAPNTDGATPPKAAVTADQQDTKQTSAYERAMAALNEAGDIRQREEGSGDVIGKMLGERPSTMDRLAEADRDPLAQEPEEQAEAEAQAEVEADAAELAPLDQPADTATPPVETKKEERVRINSLRKNEDGSFVYDERERAIMNLSDEAGISLAAAELRLFGERKPITETPAAEAPEAVKPPTAAEIDAQIAELRVRRQEAREGFDDKGADEINDQINDLTRTRQDALLRDVQSQQAQRETQSTVQQQVGESMGRAIDSYPDAAKAGSPLETALRAETERLTKAGSPLLQDADWPETLAAKVATRLGIAAQVAAKSTVAPVVKSAAPKPAAPTAPSPTKRATPLPSPGSVSGPSPQVNRVDSLRQRMNEAKARGDWNALQALGAEIGAPA
jgi:hypothetical protein